MKNLFTIIAFFAVLFFATISSAQIKETTQRMSMGEENAFYCSLETKDVKGIEKVWKKYFKEYGKSKKNRRAKEWQSKKPVSIPTSSKNTYDVYFKVIEQNDDIEAFLWADTGEYFVSSDHDGSEADKIKTMFEGFVHEANLYITEEHLDEENDRLKKLEKELKKLESKNDSYHKKIDNAKKDIIKYEENIEQNIKDQSYKNEAIDEQRIKVQKVREQLNKLD